MILNSPYISGSLTVTGNTTIQGQLTVTGSLSGTASLASNALLLQGTGSTGFATTASINEVSASQQSISASLLQVSASYIALSGSYTTFSGSASTRITANSSSIQQVSASQQQISASLLQVSASYTALSGSYNVFSGSASTRITANSSSIQQVSSSQQQISASLLQVSASYISLSGSYNTYSSSVSTRTTQIENVYATTGSNSFRANQSITGSLVVSSTITAQTLVVQTVTSSIVYSSGSNNFGNQLANTQTFTGSMNITGSCHSIFGNVGIGATAPTGQLHICGYDPAFRIQSTVSGNMQMGQWDGTNNRIQASGRDFLITVQDSYNMLFNTNATERMRISGSNGYVGIGTITPLDNLHIAASEVGNVGISIQNTNASYSSQLRFLNSAGTEKAAVTYVQSTTSMNFNINSIESLVLASTGKVGIGTSTPTSGSLQIYNSSGTNHIALNGGSYPNTYLGSFSGGTYFANNYFYASGHASDDATKRSMEFFMSQDEIDINTMPAGSPGTRTRVMTISGSQGYVGIGTTSPTHNLEIANTGGSTYLKLNADFGIGYFGMESADDSMRFVTAQATPINFYTNNDLKMIIASEGYLGTTVSSTSVTCGDLLGLLSFVSKDSSTYSSGGITNIRSYATETYNTSTVGGDLRFYVSDGLQNTTGNFCFGTEAMRIGPAGRVGIGGCAGTNAKLHVFGDVAIGDQQSGGDIRLYVSGPSSTRIPGLFNNTQSGSGSENIVLFQRFNTTVGSISSTNTTTAYNTTSDYRLKEDLKEVSGLDKISAIKVYDFKWKSNDNRMDGVLAHELQQVLPYAVIGEKDAEQMQGVDYSKLVPILVKGMQEQQCTICSQASMINTLKTCLGII